jgi:tetratricopeptide (TPR) repeat protein
MKWRYSTHLFASLGDLALARGDPAKADEWAAQALEIATRTGSRKYLVKGWRLRGEIAMARRRWEEAETALRETLTIAQQIGNPTQLWKTHVAIARLRDATEGGEAGRQGYRRAREVIERVAQSLRDPRLRASLEASAPIRWIYDRSESGE